MNDDTENWHFISQNATKMMPHDLSPPLNKPVRFMNYVNVNQFDKTLIRRSAT